MPPVVIENPILNSPYLEPRRHFRYSLYSNYEKYYRLWEQNSDARANGLTPPVFIVVCNNTNVSKLVFDYIAGWQKALPEGSSIVVPGALEVFSNERGGDWTARPNTILIDSEQLESGDAMSPEFKRIAAREIDEMLARQPLARLVTLPDVAHPIPFARPTELAALIERFLDGDRSL